MSTVTYNSPAPIEKEIIGGLNFPVEDILKSQKEKENRARKLAMALRLGNLERHKVWIDFQDSKGMHRVYTTIWSLTEKFAILKSNRRIPISRILDVRIF
ncbi:MAG: hypothetical protein N4A46_03470 [Schleiferiaceae bacterium]|jgi:hypothetical protein|nr:hypothetical protein [Schleiferiaceae bacterium]